jgi:hypothetical protein
MIGRTPGSVHRLTVPAVALGVILGLPAEAIAQSQDPNLDRIPAPATASAPPGPQPSEAGGVPQTIYLEDAVILNEDRAGLLVPPPPSKSDPWEERLFLDVRKTWRLSPNLAISLSERLNFQTENDLRFPSHENLRSDFREGYLSWRPREGTYLDFGRINLRSGVAQGSNPTDFFKTRAVVQPLSSDPSVLREDRLGVLMARGQQVWSGDAVTVAFAPRVERQTALYTNTDLPVLNPMFDRTNAHDRLLVKADLTLAHEFSPEFLFYDEDGRAQAGLNLTDSLGKAVVAYLEWSGGGRPDLIESALAYGRATGTIPQKAPSPIARDADLRFRNDVVAGLSYTTESKIVFNLEYHYFEAGFTDAAWRAWLHAGEAGPAPVRAELWYIRNWAADQGSPVSQHTLFVRADRQDAFVHGLELTGFVSADLLDGSGLAQISADYYLSDRWTVGGLVSGTFGARESDFASTPGEVSLLVKLARYF